MIGVFFFCMKPLCGAYIVLSRLSAEVFMKKRRLLLPLVFLLCSVLICCLTVGLFMLSGGQIEQPAAPPDAEQTQPESPKEPRFTVILDAGHGGEDGGAVGVGGLVEKDLNL